MTTRLGSQPGSKGVPAWALIGGTGFRGHLTIQLLPQEPLLHVALLKQEPGADFSLVAHASQLQCRRLFLSKVGPKSPRS